MFEDVMHTKQYNLYCLFKHFEKIRKFCFKLLSYTVIYFIFSFWVINKKPGTFNWTLKAYVAHIPRECE